MVANHSMKFLGEPDEKSFGSPDVAESVRVFVLNDLTADELCAVPAEPLERVVQVVDGVPAPLRSVMRTGGYSHLCASHLVGRVIAMLTQQGSLSVRT